MHGVRTLLSTPQGRRYAAQQAAKGSKFLARQYGKYKLGQFTNKAKNKVYRSYRNKITRRNKSSSKLNRKRKSKSASSYRRNRSHRRRKK